MSCMTHTTENKIYPEAPVLKRVLGNGMTVLVRTVNTLPKVSLQIWYNVGSKDEKAEERGLAHLIEHMIFKGTDKLSESDIDALALRLSGSINAFTTWDYTRYIFNMPKHTWHEILPVMADSMVNTAFKREHLNSEIKAIFQEIKLHQDNYQRTLIRQMLSAVFAGTPYHHPILGYKEELCTYQSDDLRDFYKRHYCPNNATLIVVGDVESEEVFEQAKKNFEHIPPNEGYTKKKVCFNPQIQAKSLTLYRDVKQPFALVGWVIPGSCAKSDPLLEVIASIIGSGRGSRLYKKLVNELQLVTSVDALVFSLINTGLFLVTYEPSHIENVPAIEAIIAQEIEVLIKDGIQEKELQRAVNKTHMNYYTLLESIEYQVFKIGKNWIASGDENFAFQYHIEPSKAVAQYVHNLIKSHFRESVMHRGIVAPLPEDQKQSWLDEQKESNENDQKLLSMRIRTTPIEKPIYAPTITVPKAPTFKFPQSQQLVLSNGMKMLYYDNCTTPKVTVTIELKAKDYFDDENKQGLYAFMSALLTEGTRNHTASQLADELELRGMSLTITPGYISLTMLSHDFEKGLEIIQEILLQPLFAEQDIEKVRSRILASIKSFWDEPRLFSEQLAKEKIYAGHPYSKNRLGTKEVIEKVTREDIVELHKKFITPLGAKIAVVGNLAQHNLKELLNKNLGRWQGQPVQEPAMPPLLPAKASSIIYPINRNQVVLCFAGLSVDRLNPDYDKLLLFDQIFGGGALGSLSSRLYQLREQSGLFYTIAGSLIAGSDLQPGMIMIRTTVSPDRLAEAEKAIQAIIDTAIDTVTQEELDEARNVIQATVVNNFVNNVGICQTFLALDKYGFAPNYFDERTEQLAKISLNEVKAAVKKVLSNEHLITIEAGPL